MSTMTLAQFDACRQTLPKAKRPADVKPAKAVNGIVTDMNYYNGQVVADAYRVTFGKRARTNAEVVARYNSISGRVIQREAAATSADKLLAVFIKRGSVKLLAALVEVHTSICVIWHDVTITGEVLAGDILANTTDKLPQSEIDRRIPLNGNVKTCVQRIK